MEPENAASDEQLLSWIDRGSPELDAYLARHPSERAKVDRIKESIALASSAAAARRLPESIGPYRVISLLGSGGMGIVYEAEQRAPRRRVAVKVLPPDAAADDRRVRLFRREAEALGRLSHPAIAAIHEAGRTEDGRDYVVMELAPGVPLDRHLRERNPSRRERLETFLRILDAVSHAHERGVVHRDLKPPNVLVDAEGSPKILDFGLARILDPAISSGSLTASGDGLLGTLPYMSPEQVRGGAAAAEAPSDVYALGVMLQETLTGKRPIDVDGASLPEAARRICEARPRRTSDFDPSCRGNLDAIVGRAVEKDPARRYATAASMAADVRRHLAGGTVAGARPRARLPLVLGGGVALAIAAAAALTLLLGDRPAPEVPRTYEGPRFEAPALDSDHPKAAPFTGVRVRDDEAEVELDGRWYELVSIDGETPRDLLAFCRAMWDDRAEKRFAEDLVEVLHRKTSRMPRLRVDLALRDLETGVATERLGVEMTRENRQKVWAARQDE